MAGRVIFNSAHEEIGSIDAKCAPLCSKLGISLYVAESASQLDDDRVELLSSTSRTLAAKDSLENGFWMKWTP